MRLVGVKGKRALLPLLQLDSTVCREMSVSDTDASDVTWTDNGTFNLSEGHTPQTENSEGRFGCFLVAGTGGQTDPREGSGSTWTQTSAACCTASVHTGSRLSRRRCGDG